MSLRALNRRRMSAGEIGGRVGRRWGFSCGCVEARRCWRARGILQRDPIVRAKPLSQRHRTMARAILYPSASLFAVSFSRVPPSRRRGLCVCRCHAQPRGLDGRRQRRRPWLCLARTTSERDFFRGDRQLDKCERRSFRGHWRLRQRGRTFSLAIGNGTDATQQFDRRSASTHWPTAVSASPSAPSPVECASHRLLGSGRRRRGDTRLACGPIPGAAAAGGRRHAFGRPEQRSAQRECNIGRKIQHCRGRVGECTG